MFIVDLKEYIETLTGQQMSLLQFPVNDLADPSVMIRPISSIDATGGVFNFNIEIAVKSSHPAKSCNLAGEMLLKLDKLTNKDVKGYQIILINALTSVPNYMGQTENGDYVYTVEYNILTTEI